MIHQTSNMKITIVLSSLSSGNNPDLLTKKGTKATQLQIEKEEGDIMFTLVDDQGAPSTIRFSIYRGNEQFIQLLDLMVQRKDMAEFSFKFYGIYPENRENWHLIYDGEIVKSPEPANHMNIWWDSGLLIQLWDLEYESENCYFVVDGDEFLKAVRFFSE